jgi:hypothetical protein
MELKFRVWNKISQKMHEWKDIKAIPLKDFELEHCKIIQFTGVKDNEGKDIYEGDVLEFYGSYRVVIFFERGSFGYLSESDDFVTLHETNLHRLKLIDSIYKR